MALPSSAQQVNKKIKGGNQLGSAIIRSIGEAAKIGIIWVVRITSNNGFLNFFWGGMGLKKIDFLTISVNNWKITFIISKFWGKL